MTAFSLVVFIAIVLLLAVRYQRALLPWLSNSARSSQIGNGNQHCPSDLKRMTPYPAPPVKGRERYRVMMDIRKLDVPNWLTIDKNYMDEHRVRSQLLHEKKEKVLQCLPESLAACQETLQEVSDFLCQRFPIMFDKTTNRTGTQITNRMTGEKFAVDGQNLDPLEAAVRLTMEDLSILMRNEDDEYYLAASASLFPTGWTVEDRIGWTISQLHEPVPLWHQHVAHSVSKFLARLTPTSSMERSSYFIEVKRPGENLFDILYRPHVLCEKELSNPAPQEIIVRRERQTFRRLPRTGAIVFTVKTYLTALDELPVQELQNLVKEMKSWPEYVGEYKGRDVWGAKVLEFCENRTGLCQRKDEKAGEV